MKNMLPGLLIVSALLAGGLPASAQSPYGPGPLRQGFGMAPNQPVSPYINIFRAGAPFGINYYNILQPQLQLQGSLSQLQQETTQFQTGASANALPATGHAAYFDNRLHYYGRRPGSTGAQGASGAPFLAAAPGTSRRGIAGTSYGMPGRAPSAPAGTGGTR